MDQKINQTYQDIKELRVQGATDVARATLSALQEYGQRVAAEDRSEWQEKMTAAAERLLSARPTEPLAQNGVQYLWSVLESVKKLKLVRQSLEKAVDDFMLLIQDSKDLIATNGQNLIKENDKIFVHCHSSSVVNILRRAFNNGEEFEVFNSETRPLYQGRITAQELTEIGISVTMVVDSAVSYFISSQTGEEYDMDMFLIGADALLKDGSTYNKIGSYGMSLAAEHSEVPVYIAASLLKFYPAEKIEIEKRDPAEIWPEAPEKVNIINYAFDEVFQEGITGIITEAGVIKPEEVRKKAYSLYPWLKK